MLAGGGTTCGPRVEAPDRASDPPDAEGGGGTGLVRMSPVAVLPQLLRSRLTCDGGGATTVDAGSDSLAADDMSRGGAETGGATTSTVWVTGVRELARSRCASRGAGAMTVGVSWFGDCILSRDTFGAGGTMLALKVGEVRVAVFDTSGAGAMMVVVRVLAVRLADELRSGEGGTALIAGRVGAVREERKPSAGGGPGLGLIASRLATAESECGRFMRGASATFSRGCSPRTTRMVCVRWWAC